jgi:antitoxin component HigA of HigAB toxin-antitoxin module
MRMLNAIEAGTLTGSQLETLLTSDPGRLAELNVLLGLRGQARRMAASSTAMEAVAASSTAMEAVAASSTAMQAVAASSTAREAFFGSSFSVGKGLETLIGTTNATLASLQTMSAVAASSTAMEAVAASSTAMEAVAASSTAMEAVAASQNALAAIRQSSTAISAINASSQALDILYNAATKFTHAGSGWSANPATLVTGNFLLVRVRQITNPGGWGDGGATSQYIRIGGSGWTATNGQSTSNLINRTTLPHVYDNALRPVNNTTIQYYLYNSYEIAYLAA